MGGASCLRRSLLGADSIGPRSILSDCGALLDKGRRRGQRFTGQQRHGVVEGGASGFERMLRVALRRTPSLAPPTSNRRVADRAPGLAQLPRHAPRARAGHALPDFLR
jgi:hypothetical protein